MGEAIGKIGQTVFKLSTPLAPQQPNHRRAEYIIERSRQNYGLHPQWEATVKRRAPKLIASTSAEEAVDIDPQRIF